MLVYLAWAFFGYYFLSSTIIIKIQWTSSVGARKTCFGQSVRRYGSSGSIRGRDSLGKIHMVEVPDSVTKARYTEPRCLIR